MKVLRDPLGADDPPRGTVLSIGNFDGVHVGHQAVLRHVRDRANELSASAAVMTFDPHPVKLLRPSAAPRLLTTLEQRLELIAREGIDVALVVPFTHRLSRMTATRFVHEVLADRLGIREAYIGANFRFGADRGGDVALLTELGRRLGFAAAAWPTVQVGGAVVSSSRVRDAVDRGEVEMAGRLLGRAPFIDGYVLEGRRLGRTLGFPTLNLEVENELRPAGGVYVTAVHVPSFERTFESVTNIGVRPTVHDSQMVTIETHVFDFSADVYRERVRLFFLRRLRDERSFPSAEVLVEQIGADVAAARRFFGERDVADLGLIEP